MIVNFYKRCSREVRGYNLHGYKLIASKNISFVPQKEALIKVKGNFLKVNNVCFNIENNTWEVYLLKA